MGEIFVNYVTGNVLILNIYEEFIQFNDQQAQITQLGSGQRTWTDICLKMWKWTTGIWKGAQYYWS